VTRDGDVVTMPTVVTSESREPHATVNKLRLVANTVHTVIPYLALSFSVQVSEKLSMDSTKDLNHN